MAGGRRREERQRVIDLAGWVGAMFGKPVTEYAIHQYLRKGAMSDGSEREMPASPEVDELAAKIEANGGVLKMEWINGGQG